MIMGSEQTRFLQQERRKHWVGCCWGGWSCFGSQKGGKRIVPASRSPEGNATVSQQHRPQAAGLPNQATTLSLLAPPSSPASFSNSGLPSTAQSPSCYLSLSANSPGGPSNAMYATGPYAHETQLVSPPVFSTFTTEPSTAPLTPPPELAHITTPSSPDVPFAKFLSSSVDLKGANRTNYIAANDLHATYSLYPGSPASGLRSPISRASGGCPSPSFPGQWEPSVSPQDGKYSGSSSGRLSGVDTPGTPVLSQDINFFCPDTFARYYQDHDPPFPHGTGRLSVSKDSDVYNNASGNGNQNRAAHNKSSKQDVEEIEAYRASFGFSADEIISTPQYVEISDIMDESLVAPSTYKKQPTEEKQSLLNQKNVKSEADLGSENDYEGYKSQKQGGNICGSRNGVETDEKDILSKMGSPRKYYRGLSNSDAEIDYRRGRSAKKKGMAWHDID